MVRPPPAGSIWGRDIWLRWYSAPELRPPYVPPPLFPRSGEPWTLPPDRGVKCRQLSLLPEAAGAVEFPGRGTLLDVPAGDMPEGRFIPPLCCAEFASENRRHPEPSEVVDLPVRSLLKLAPRLDCGAAEPLLNPPLDGVRTPGAGRATEF